MMSLSFLHSIVEIVLVVGMEEQMQFTVTDIMLAEVKRYKNLQLN